MTFVVFAVVGWLFLLVCSNVGCRLVVVGHWLVEVWLVAASGGQA